MFIDYRKLERAGYTVVKKPDGVQVYLENGDSSLAEQLVSRVIASVTHLSEREIEMVIDTALDKLHTQQIVNVISE